LALLDTRAQLGVQRRGQYGGKLALFDTARGRKLRGRILAEEHLRALREQNFAGGAARTGGNTRHVGLGEQPATERHHRVQALLRFVQASRRVGIGNVRLARCGRQARCERIGHDAPHQIVIVRLGQGAHDAQLARHLAHFAFVIRGRTEDNGKVGRALLLAHLADELVAVHARHDDVGDQQIGPLTAQHLVGFDAVGRREHVVARAEHEPQQLACFGIIFGDENRSGHAANSDGTMKGGRRPCQRYVRHSRNVPTPTL